MGQVRLGSEVWECLHRVQCQGERMPIPWEAPGVFLLVQDGSLVSLFHTSE